MCVSIIYCFLLPLPYLPLPFPLPLPYLPLPLPSLPHSPNNLFYSRLLCQGDEGFAPVPTDKWRTALGVSRGCRDGREGGRVRDREEDKEGKLTLFFSSFFFFVVFSGGSSSRSRFTNSHSTTGTFEDSFPSQHWQVSKSNRRNEDYLQGILFYPFL